MILGLDVSTSITGYTIIENGNVVLNGAWDTRKYKDFFKKAEVVKEGLHKIYEEYGDGIDAVYIEQSLQSFRSGFSSAKTLSTLARFNGIVSWVIYNRFGKTPEYIAATSARKLCGIKVPRGQKAKQVVIQYLLDNEPAFKIEYTRTGKPKPYCFDMADSLVIAKAGFICENESKS